MSAIISHTPIWVWPLLAFLLYRGWQATRDRETSLFKALAMPLVMLGLSLSGLVAGFASHPFSTLLGATCLAASALLSYRSGAARAIRVDPQRRRLAQRGSWTGLLLIVGIFVVKYGVAVLHALHPQLTAQAWFALPQAALYGAFSGIFAGRLLRIGQSYRQALAAPAAQAATAG